jgi:ubiquinol-cytochrome c reductase cytochrome c1 subunit
MRSQNLPRLCRLYLILLLLAISYACPNLATAEEAVAHLDKARVDLTDLASLQRGAKLFMNYCSGCHSLKYIRYNTLAKDIGIVDPDGKVLEQAVKENLMFVGDKITDTIQSSLTKKEGAAWFGTAPPDLSLVSRSRGADWLYTYLRSFYPDPKRPWGVNNKVFPDVAMPDVLFNLRAELNAQNDGKESKENFDRAVLDLVSFLSYAGEPNQLVRQRVGLWVLLFLGVFFVFAWLLKREYWKDVH